MTSTTSPSTSAPHPTAEPVAVVRTDSDAVATQQSRGPRAGRLVYISVHEGHVALGVLLADLSLAQVAVVAVPAPDRARRHLAGLRRVLSVHIDFSSSEPACRLRATTRWPTDRHIPLGVALALAMDGTPTSVLLPN